MNSYEILKQNGLELVEVDQRVHPELDLSGMPALNVLDEKTFRARVALIFDMVANALQKSYGPYGSSTIISNYPFQHVTKDGYSIMKVLAFAKDKTTIDDAIKNLIERPCGRLNYAVGDSTTTVILAVNAIYKICMDNLERFNSLGLSPRDILKAYDQVRDRIIEKLENETHHIDISNHEEMVDIIGKIAYISSNGDENITNIIKELYDELDSPMIEIVKSKTDKTSKTITRGYHYNCVLKDGMYINNDNMTGEYKEVDVLIFDHKVTMNTFDYILFPLNDDCRAKGRHLVVIAPSYDDVAMRTVKRKLIAEHQQTGIVNLILTAGEMAHGINRDLTEDLAILLNTTIINMGIEDMIITKIKNKTVDSFRNILDTNVRGIPNIVVTAKNKEGQIGYTTDNGHLPESAIPFELDEDMVRVGFAGRVSIGFKNGTTMSDFYYSDFTYDANIHMIENALNEAKKKSEAISSYNFQAMELQKRLFNFKMRMGTIEVGGQSGLSQDMLYDAVEDAIKATSSAYYNGVTKGCSVSILRATAKVHNEYDTDDEVHRGIAKIIFYGFCDVYKILLGSKLVNHNLNKEFTESNYTTRDIFERLGITGYIGYGHNTINGVGEHHEDYFDVVINESLLRNQPLDLISCKFSDDIINTAKSDKEVLLATSDLISLLITGNQFIVTERER